MTPSWMREFYADYFYDGDVKFKKILENNADAEADPKKFAAHIIKWYWFCKKYLI